MTIRRRFIPYAFAVLVAIVLALLPSAIFADLVIPLESWENWYWQGHPHPRPNFTLANPPSVLRGEIALFKVLAGPPGWVREKVTGFPTVYSAMFAERATSYESGGRPAFAYAISHLTWALPLWFFVLVAVYELVAFLRTKITVRS